MTMVLPCVKSNRAPIAQETRIIQKIQAKQTKMESGNEIKFWQVCKVGRPGNQILMMGWVSD